MHATVLFFVLLFFSCINMAESNHAIHVNVTHIKQITGQLFVGLFNRAEDYPIGKKAFTTQTVAIKTNRADITFEKIPEGEYAIAVYHDINSNGKLDFTFYGKPEEPTGASNDATGFMGPPAFEEAKFSVTQPTTITLKLNN